MTRAFSLIELLIVAALIAVLGALMVPAFTSVASGSAITRAESMVADQLAFARQEAAGRNREVQVRFIWKDGQPPGYRGIQIWMATPRDVTAYRPVARVAWLPQGVMFAPDAALSPLLSSNLTLETNGSFAGIGNANYRLLRFRPGGATTLPFDTTNAFLTVLKETDASASTPPPNSALVQIDPVNGRVRVFRP